MTAPPAACSIRAVRMPTDKCREQEPALNTVDGGRQSKCHYPLDDAGRPTL